MLKSAVLFPVLFSGLLAVSDASAATYKAHVEKGNTVVIVGTSKRAERCETKVEFDYTDPKEPTKRQRGFQICGAASITPGKPTVMCSLDYPIVDATIASKVKAYGCAPN